MALGARIVGLLACMVLIALGGCRFSPHEAEDYVPTSATATSGSGPNEVATDEVGPEGPDSTEGETQGSLESTVGAVTEGSGSTTAGDTQGQLDSTTSTEGSSSTGTQSSSSETGTESGSVCGDGVVEGTEECDHGGESATCNADCSVSVCGDGIVNVTALEQCDHMGESATCTVDCSTSYCGDEVINATASEQCDGPNLDEATCASEDSSFDGGVLTCDAACQLDTTHCFGCGDGALNPGEQCDGDALGSETCVDFGFQDGYLACTTTCSYDTRGCFNT